jgi:pilus assembly protein Flp/PilA
VGVSTIFSKFRRFASDDSGLTAIEYALIAGIIAMAIAASFTSVQTELSTIFTTVGSELKNNAAN